MASPGDETAAGAKGHARLRVLAADREQAIELLKAAFVQEGITKDELDRRIGTVLVSQTYEDLNIVTGDIPSGLTRAQPAVPARRPGHGKKVIWRTSAALGGTVFVMTEAVVLQPSRVGPGLVAGFMAGVFVAGLLAVLLTLIAWVIDRSSGRQSSQRSATRRALSRNSASRLGQPRWTALAD